jgi:ABC-type branched-subunit amino acid transport system substrate-binding protein
MKRTTAVFLSVLLFATACDGSSSKSGGGGGDVPGVTDAEVVVGTHMPLTGPAAAGYSKIAPASKAYFDFVNASGGINGRKINFISYDDA